MVGHCSLALIWVDEENQEMASMFFFGNDEEGLHPLLCMIEHDICDS
jgi:hypothetical protein